MVNKIITLTENELETLIRKACRETVSETFLALGIDTEDPISVQSDFRFLRETRSATESVKRQGILIAIGIFIAATLGMLWVGFKNMVHGP